MKVKQSIYVLSETGKNRDKSRLPQASGGLFAKILEAPSTSTVTTKATSSGSTKTALCLSAAILFLTAVSPQTANAEWGNIGGGWKTTGDGKPVEATARTTRVVASRSQASAAPVTTTTGNTQNRALVRSVAQRYANSGVLRNAGIQPREFVIFFENMILVESAFNDRARSSAGAIGLAQLMPGTAKYLGVDPHNKRQNVDGGARYLIEQIETFGTLSLAVAAYNAGPEAVRKYNGVPPYRETERHVAKVLSLYERQWRKLNQGANE